MKTIWEYLADKIANSSSVLLEMAYERKSALNILRNLQYPIKEHFIKYLAIDSPNDKQHWIVELNGYFRKIDDISLKPNGKKLNPLSYWNILWDEPLGHGVEAVTRTIKRLVNHDYANCKRTKLTDYQIYEILEKIYHDICYDLASDKFLDTAGIQPYISKYAPSESHI